MSGKHTPGPWHVSTLPIGEDVIGIETHRHEWIAEVLRYDDSEADANALLIAAAPELLEAAKTALTVIDFCLPYIALEEDQRVVAEKALRAAIAKAEGN